MKDILLDIIKHTANMGFFDCVEVVGTDDGTYIKAKDTLSTVILNAKAKEIEPSFNGKMGLGNLSYLRGIANIDAFRKEDAEWSISKRDREGVAVPENIVFKGSDNTEVSYRLMHESIVPDIPAFKGTEWDIEFTPKKKRIEDFAQLASLHSELEEQFIVKIVDGNLMFFIGEENSASHKAQFVFESNINETLDTVMKWPIQHVLQVLRLSQSGTSTMKISHKGVLCISIDSGLADYDFLILASQK